MEQLVEKILTELTAEELIDSILRKLSETKAEKLLKEIMFENGIEEEEEEKDNWTDWYNDYDN